MSAVMGFPGPEYPGGKVMNVVSSRCLCRKTFFRSSWYTSQLQMVATPRRVLTVVSLATRANVSR